MPYLRLPPLPMGDWDSPDCQRVIERLRVWARHSPDIARLFWDGDGRGPTCVFCRRNGLPWSTGMTLHVALALTGPAAQRVAQYGIDALWAHPPEEGEIWYGWCTECPTPTSDAEGEAAVRAILDLSKRIGPTGTN